MNGQIFKFRGFIICLSIILSSITNSSSYQWVNLSATISLFLSLNSQNWTKLITFPTRGKKKLLEFKNLMQLEFQILQSVILTNRSIIQQTGKKHTHKFDFNPKDHSYLKVINHLHFFFSYFSPIINSGLKARSTLFRTKREKELTESMRGVSRTGL